MWQQTNKGSGTRETERRLKGVDCRNAASYRKDGATGVARNFSNKSDWKVLRHSALYSNSCAQRPFMGYACYQNASGKLSSRPIPQTLVRRGSIAPRVYAPSSQIQRSSAILSVYHSRPWCMLGPRQRDRYRTPSPNCEYGRCVC